MLAVILLATYNGERFIGQQLQSLLDQTHKQWLLIAKDDGSSDSTREILRTFRNQHPQNVHLLGQTEQNLGPLRLFSNLIEHVLNNERDLGLPDDYCIGFCDQDDIWHPDKLRTAVNRLHRERKGPSDHLLVHHELAVIDANGEQIASKFTEYQGIDPSRDQLADLVRVNVASGCASLLTPALARASVPVPDDAAMYDWWIALVAAQLGRICFIDQPLLAYRQHSGNAIGASPADSRRTLVSRLRLLMSTEKNRAIVTIARQASYLQANPARPLSGCEKRLCRLTALLRFNNIALRLITFKLLKLARTQSAAAPE